VAYLSHTRSNPSAANTTNVTSTQRLFLALWPEDEVRTQLTAHTRQWRWPAGCARYLPADWHVTLHFIGNVGADQTEGIASGADVPFQPFVLKLDQPQLWPHGLAVLCASGLPQPLQALYDQLAQVLHGLGLAVEARPYQPHVTLARRAGAAAPPTACAPVLWQAHGYALVVSTGDREQRYRVIRQYRR